MRPRRVAKPRNRIVDKPQRHQRAVYDAERAVQEVLPHEHRHHARHGIRQDKDKAECRGNLHVDFLELHREQQTAKIARRRRKHRPHERPDSNARKAHRPVIVPRKQFLEVLQTHPVNRVVRRNMRWVRIVRERHAHAENQRHHHEHHHHHERRRKTENRKRFAHRAVELLFLALKALSAAILGVSLFRALHAQEIHDCKNDDDGQNQNAVDEHKNRIVAPLYRKLGMRVAERDKTNQFPDCERQTTDKHNFAQREEDTFYIIAQIQEVRQPHKTRGCRFYLFGCASVRGN